MSELKPCPFCGGEAQVQHQSRELYGDAVDWYGVYCKKQFCGYVSGQSTEAEAVAAWNTRSDDYKQAAEYWQRMYEQAFAERTCHDVKPSLPYFKCDSCGMEDMGGTELWIQDGFYRSQKPNYCPNCGAKVVGE